MTLINKPFPDDRSLCPRSGGDLRRRDLSLSIQALTVACVDPKNFHGRDLVSELRALVSTGNGTAFELLVLCNAGDAMSDKDVERIAEIFDSQHRPFWTGNAFIYRKNVSYLTRIDIILINIGITLYMMYRIIL